MDPGEGPFMPHSGTLEPSAEQSTEQIWEILESFTPFPSAGMV